MVTSTPPQKHEIKSRLNDELRFNPLDVELPPNRETGADEPKPMVWTLPKSEMDLAALERNPECKNSMFLLDAIKSWELELPDM